MTQFKHVPIMLDEALSLLEPERGGTFVDGTLGGGGHAEAVLKRLPEGSRFYGIDRDDAALAGVDVLFRQEGEGRAGFQIRADRLCVEAVEP